MSSSAMIDNDVTKVDNVGDDNGCSDTQPAASSRKNYGRAARRRRRKMAEILRAEEQLRESMKCPSAVATPKQRNVHMTADEPNLIIPNDRNRVWPGVQEQRRLRSQSLKKDAPELTAQLGYIPGNAIRVAARIQDVSVLRDYYTSQGQEDFQTPVVLQLYPIAVRDEHLGGKKKGRKFKSRKRRRTINKNSDINNYDTTTNNDRETISDEASDANLQSSSSAQDARRDLEDSCVVEPFPTLYWLTHPLLRTLVSKLELQSVGTQLEQRLAKDSHALESMTQAHAAYGQQRYELLTKDDITYIQQRSWESAFSSKRGVAGIHNYASVKCLHAHVAHYLSGGTSSSNNVIGKWVMESIADMLKSDKKVSVDR